MIRVLPQEAREASILSIAVTGVMAGCRPEYMPVLIAVIEAMCDPEFRVEDCGSTPGWEPMVIVNGPIVKQLDFNQLLEGLTAPVRGIVRQAKYPNLP